MRTVTSVINRTPKEVLREIILVDDFSSRSETICFHLILTFRLKFQTDEISFLKDELDKFVATLSARIKIVRAQRRVGLIRARLLGSAEAEGDVLTFLDSHCECTKGWIEPLLTRIKEDRWYASPPEILKRRASDPSTPIE
ncbi:unnamed protein product [Anisakis simplex]|uniref:Glycosyltransferase 2-like domain-containing protein n=1 Tax=Anisakis simplex TaxID=6269 RepID=A0A3P6NU14_ANISI|nr:unnamed protein product [Anisakis simplex]